MAICRMTGIPPHAGMVKDTKKDTKNWTNVRRVWGLTKDTPVMMRTISMIMKSQKMP